MTARTLLLEPVVSWPREVEPGGTYLVTVDLRTSTEPGAWPFDEEEFEFSCLLDAHPLFTSRPLDDPNLVLHRFGGTYGKVRFLLTANDPTGLLDDGERPSVWLTYVNRWGVPARTVELPVRFVNARQAPRPDVHRLLFRMDEAEGGFRIQAEIVDARGEPMGKGWEHTISGNDVPEVPNLTTATEDALASVGGELFRLLTAGELAEAWRQGVERLVLDVRPAPLRALPWELLIDNGGRCPFSRIEQPAVRGTLPYQPDQPELAVPIRLMVVLGDLEDGTVDSAAEIDAIYRGLSRAPARWQVDVLVKPSMDKLRAALAGVRPHVLHVIGHSTTTDVGPMLRIVADNGEWGLTARFVALAAEPPPRLVVLNACRTADQTAAHEVWDAFLREGVAAVVSTQSEVASAAAARFAQTFYSELVSGRPVDVAVAEARGKLQYATDMGPADWAASVIDTAAEPSSVLRHTWRLESKEVLLRYHELRDVPYLVGRSAELRQLHRAVEAPENRLIYVSGDAGVGKTMLVRSFVLTRVQNAAPVVYMTLEGRAWVGTVDFVQTVAQAAKRWLGDYAAPLCDAALDALADQVEDPPILLARPAESSGAIDPRYEVLQGLLVALARTEPFVVVLDDVTRIDDRGALVNGLLVPAARGGLHGVQMIVVDHREKMRELIDRWVSPQAEIEVRNFARQDAVQLVREYFARRRPDEVASADKTKRATFEQFIRMWVEQRAKALTDDVAPLEIVDLYALYSAEASLQ